MMLNICIFLAFAARILAWDHVTEAVLRKATSSDGDSLVACECITSPIMEEEAPADMKRTSYFGERILIRVQVELILIRLLDSPMSTQRIVVMMPRQADQVIKLE